LFGNENGTAGRALIASEQSSLNQAWRARPKKMGRGARGRAATILANGGKAGSVDKEE